MWELFYLLLHVIRIFQGSFSSKNILLNIWIWRSFIYANRLIVWTRYNNFFMSFLMRNFCVVNTLIIKFFKLLFAFIILLRWCSIVSFTNWTYIKHLLLILSSLFVWFVCLYGMIKRVFFKLFFCGWFCFGLHLFIAYE